MFEKALQKYKSLPIQIKATFWFLICSFLQKGISMITTPIFTRLLSTAEYGQYSVFNSWLGIATIFVSLNLSYGVYTQGLIKFDSERNVYSSSLQGLSLTLCLAWTIIYFVFHDFWNRLFSLSTVQMMAMLIMIWTTAVFGFWAAEQRVKYSYRRLVAITLFVSLAKPIFGIFLVTHSHDKVTARILSLVIVELAVYVWLFFSQMHQGKVFFSSKFWKHALIFSIPLIPHYLSQTVLNSADRIMIDRMVNSETAGIYSLAYSISQIMTLFSTALLQALNPWIYQKLKDRKVKDITKVAYPSLIAIAGVNILLIALAPEIVAVFAPKSYYDAIWIIPPVSMSVYFIYAYSLFADFEFYYEKTQYITFATVIGAVFNVVLNYIFIPRFGYYAAGYTTLFCYLLYNVFHYRFMNKICDEYLDGESPYNTKYIVAITAVFLAIGFSFLAVYNHSVIRYLYVAVLLLIIVINRKKILRFMNTLMSVKGNK